MSTVQAIAELTRIINVVQVQPSILFDKVLPPSTLSRFIVKAYVSETGKVRWDGYRSLAVAARYFPCYVGSFRLTFSGYPLDQTRSARDAQG